MLNLPPNRLYPLLIAGASIALLLGAFAFQHIGGLEPCVLCVYQRYPHGAVAALGLIGVMLPAPRATGAVLVLAAVVLVAGAVVAGFHVGVEQKWWAGLPGCAGELPRGLSIEEMMKRAGKPPPRCDEVPWSLFGVSMAGYNLVISLGLAGVGIFGARKLWKAA